MPRPAEFSRAAAAPDAVPRRKPVVRHPFRRKILRPGTLALYVAAIAALAAARPVPGLFAAGLVLAAAGQALRLWATGYLLKTDELTTAGPYAHLRHPLYAGALLMGTGFALMGGPLVAAAVIPAGLVFYFGYYLRRKERVEAARLEAIYGDDFRAYRDAVPALLPRLRPWRPAGSSAPPPWRLERVLENDEQSALATALAALAALLLIWWLRGP